MRPYGSAKQLERRRYKAVALHRQGRKIPAIAAQVNATPQAVRQWLRSYRLGGAGALAAKPVPGRPCKLSAAKRQRLQEYLLKGPQAVGFATDLWTCPRVSQLIRDRLGVSYHVDHIPRLLSGLGFSPSEAPGASQGT